MVFCTSLLGLILQLKYLFEQNFEDVIITSSWKYRVDNMPLPIIYLCSILNG